MKRNHVDDPRTCNERIASGWHYKRCGRPGKFFCIIDIGNNLTGYTKAKGVRCGIHAKRHELIGPYTPEQSTGS